MLGQVRGAGDIVKPGKAMAAEARSYAGKLMDCAQFGELAARQPEMANRLGGVGRGSRWRFERLLREVVATVDVDELLGVRLDMVEDLT